MRLFIMLLLLSSTIIANIIKLDSNVTDVTVFNDRAEVTRKIVATVEKGRVTLKFTAIPNSIDENSIRVEGKGNVVLTTPPPKGGGFF